MAGEQELEILYQALGSPLGLVLVVSDFTLASQRLYRARRESGDEALQCLQIRRSPCDPDGTEIWLVKGQMPVKKEPEGHAKS